MDDHLALIRAILIVVMVVLLPIGMYYRLTSQSTGEKLDRRQEGVFILATLRPLGAVFWFGVLAWMINPRWMAWSSIATPLWSRWAGVPLLVAGAALVMWTFRSLGKNLTDTVVTRTDHTLVGPWVRYRWLRTSLVLVCSAVDCGAIADRSKLVSSDHRRRSALRVIMRTRTEEQNSSPVSVTAIEVHDRTRRFMPMLARSKGRQACACAAFAK